MLWNGVLPVGRAIVKETKKRELMRVITAQSISTKSFALFHGRWNTFLLRWKVGPENSDFCLPRLEKVFHFSRLLRDRPENQVFYSFEIID